MLQTNKVREILESIFHTGATENGHNKQIYPITCVGIKGAKVEIISFPSNGLDATLFII